MAENESNHESWKSPRLILAFSVLGISIIGIFLLAWKILDLADPAQDKLETAKTVFTAILPVLATWVGTVLAYYFSRENFESANRNVREMVNKVTSMEKLQSVSVSKALIPIKDMVCFRLSVQKPDEGAVFLHEDLIGLLKNKNRNRLPILDQNDNPKYVIHRSLIDRYFSERSLPAVTPAAAPVLPAGATTPVDLARLTLKDMIEHSSEEVKKFLRVSFATVKETDTLADAKREMDRENGRLDVLVTKDGTADSPVVGWITNLIISDHATV
jgi:hypothetical protein